MATTALFPIGTKLFRKNPSSGTYEAVPQVVVVGFGSVTTDYDDITNHDSTGGYKEQMALLKDPGEIACELIFNPDDTMHQTLFADNAAGALRSWRVRLPNTSASETDFDAFVTGLNAPAEVTRAMRLSFTLRRSGAPTFNW